MRFFVLSFFFAAAAFAQNAPRAAKVAKLEIRASDSGERMEMTRVQILLDQANFRPGKIDGLGGELRRRRQIGMRPRMAFNPGLASIPAVWLTPIPPTR